MRIFVFSLITLQNRSTPQYKVQNYKVHPAFPKLTLNIFAKLQILLFHETGLNKAIERASYFKKLFG